MSQLKKSSEFKVTDDVTVDGVKYTKVKDATPAADQPQGITGGENCEVWTTDGTDEWTATEGFENGITPPAFNPIA